MGNNLKPEEPEPKKQRLLKTINMKEQIRTSYTWHKLPYQFLVQVFSYLNNSDRLVMAQVCRAWYTSFKDPSIWKSIKINLGGPEAKKTGENWIRFVSMFGSGLTDVVIRCNHVTTYNHKCIGETVVKLLRTLENESSKMYRLEIIDLELDGFDRFPALKNNIGRCLVKMLKSQTALKHVAFENCQIPYLVGRKVLTALQKSSRKTLETLHINYVYQPFVDGLTNHTYLDIMTLQKFTNKRDISFVYSYKPKEELLRRSVDMKAKIEEFPKRVGRNRHAIGKELNKEPKVKDKVSEPKSQHVLETLEKPEEMLVPPDWDRLPDHLTVQVYSYLKKNSDRLAMAQVCQAWYESFKDPSLWRSREFTLGGPFAKRTSKKVIQFASMFGSGLKEVVLRCQHRTPNTCKIITETMENLMKKLDKARLCRLELLDLTLDKFKKFPNLKETVKDYLVKMFISQTALKHVTLQNCEFNIGPGTEVLTALQESSGHTLETLHIKRCFLKRSDVLGANKRLDFPALFTNLREISLHYNYISEEMLQNWTVNLKSKLKRIIIEVLETEPNSHVITRWTWRNLAKACPQLAVDLSISDFSHTLNMIPLLAPGMPLTQFYMMSLDIDHENEEESQIAPIMKHLADHFDKYLQSIKLIIPYLEDSADNEIIRIVEGCLELREIHLGLSDRTGRRIATALCNDSMHRQIPSIRLQREHYANTEYSFPYRDIVITF